jgi:surface carbohydrate biosynthesis protein
MLCQSRVGIVVDHPTRDLFGAVQSLVARGVSVSLVPFYHQQVDLPDLNLDLIILNYARPANLAFARRCREAGILVAILDSEGGLLPKSGPTSARGIADFLRESGYGDLLAGYLCWGEAMAETLRCHSGMPAAAIVVTGCPRFDFARSPWNGILPARDADRVLVNTNFPIINNRFANDGLEDRLALKSVGLSDERTDQLLEECRAVRAAVTEAVKALAGQFPNKRFLVRPHPFERDTYYRAYFAGLPNVSVSHEGTALEAIGAAAAVVHVNCTTAIEAVMCDVLPIGLEYCNRPMLRDAAWLAGQVSRNALDYASLAGMIADIDSESRAFDFSQVHREHIQPYFHLADGRAHDRATEQILFLLERNKSAEPSVPSRMSRRGGTLAQSLYAGFAALIGSRLTGKLRALVQPKRRGKTFAAGDVIAMLRKIEELTDAPAATVRHARNGFGGQLASINVERLDPSPAPRR